MHALTIEPLCDVTDFVSVIGKAFSSLAEQDQPKRATEETQECGIDNR